MRVLVFSTLSVLLTMGACAPDPPTDLTELERQVLESERAFARSMADRDPAAFAELLASDAVFFSGERAIRGRDAVGAEWRPLFDGPEAPFSWEPDQVQVLESGELALSTGPVRDPAGRVTGRFNSIWRREAPGRWRVVFDKGSSVCECDGAPTSP